MKRRGIAARLDGPIEAGDADVLAMNHPGMIR
jgi:hypothetical protein